MSSRSLFGLGRRRAVAMAVVTLLAVTLLALSGCAPGTPVPGGGPGTSVPVDIVVDPTTGLVVGHPTPVPGSVGGVYLFLPAAQPTDRLVVCVHGGGWSQGSIDELPSWISALTNEGWNVASVDYRKSTANPAAADDVGASVRFLEASTMTTPERTVLVGHSAGGHLAEMVAFGADNGRTFGAPVGALVTIAPTHSVWALANYSYSLGDGVINGLLRCNPGVFNLGGFPPCEAGVLAAAEPCELIDAADPPSYTVALDDDIVVPPSLGAFDLDRDLRAAGARSTLEHRPGLSHELSDPNDPAQADLRNAILGWIRDTAPDDSGGVPSTTTVPDETTVPEVTTIPDVSTVPAMTGESGSPDQNR